MKKKAKTRYGRLRLQLCMVERRPGWRKIAITLIMAGV
jgi:hypothetical protein